MGGYNIGEVFAALTLDDSQFIAALERSKAEIALTKANLADVTTNLRGLQSNLASAGISFEGFNTYLKKLYAQGFTSAESVNVLGESLRKLQQRVYEIQAQSLGVTGLGPFTKDWTPQMEANRQAILKLAADAKLANAAIAQNSGSSLFGVNPEDKRIRTELEKAEAIRAEANAANMAMDRERLASARAVDEQITIEQQAVVDRYIAQQEAAAAAYVNWWEAALAKRDAMEEASAARRMELAQAITVEQQGLQDRFDAEQIASAEKVAAARKRLAEEIAIEQQGLEDRYLEKLEAEQVAQAANTEQARLRFSMGPSGPRPYLYSGSSLPVSTGVLVGGAAGIGAALALGKITKAAAEASQATDNLAREMGVTYQQAKDLQEVSKVTGTDLNNFTQASWKLAEALQEGGTIGKRAAQVLNDLGVEGKTSGELMFNFLDKLSRITDQERRSALAHDVLGRSSEAFVILADNWARGKIALMELDTLTGPHQQENLQNEALQINLLSIAWQRFGNTIASSPLGKMTAFGFGQVGALFGQSSKLLRFYEGIPGFVANSAKLNQTKIDEKSDEKAANQTRSYNSYMNKALQDELADDARKSQDQLLKTDKETIQARVSQLKKEKSDLVAEMTRTTNPISRDQRVRDDTDVKAKEKEISDLEARLKGMEKKIKPDKLDFFAPLLSAYKEAQKEQKETFSLIEIDIDNNLAHQKAVIAQRAELAKKSQVDTVADVRARAAIEVQAAQEEFYATRDAINQKLAAIKGGDAEALRMQYRLNGQLVAARDEAKKQFIEIGIRASKEISNIETKGQDRANSEQESAERKHQDAVYELRRKRTEDSYKFADITKSEELSRLREIDRQALQSQKNSIDSQIAEIDALTKKTAYDVQERQRLVNQKQALDDAQAEKERGYQNQEREGLTQVTAELEKQLEVRRRLLQEGNTSVQTWNLNNLKLQNESLKTVNEGFGGLAATVTDSTTKAFDNLGTSILDATIKGKDFGKTMDGVLKAIPATILGSVLQAFMKLATAELIAGFGGGKALGFGARGLSTGMGGAMPFMPGGSGSLSNLLGLGTTGLGLATALGLFTPSAIAGTAAASGTAVAASTGILSLVSGGTAAGAGAAAASSSGLLSMLPELLPLLAFDSGGRVPRDMIAQVHGGEEVIDRSLSASLREMVARNGSSNQGATVHMHNPRISPGTSAESIRGFMNSAVRTMRAKGVRVGL